ncbi:MAG: hypothetical protein OFPI_01670 [Osedax symbiont Rs2]|nr:MAG: hypothetical protein OFPI_01670 [Osedax symbiont Rs2]
MVSLIRLVISITASMFCLSVTADIVFPANQFGRADLRPKQSLGGQSDFIRSQKNAVFEPISEFNESDEFRKKSSPVGRLSLLVRSAKGEESVATCTATLIARDRVLTNYHCLPGFSGKVLKALIHFGYLRQDQDPVAVYQVNTTALVADAALDFALLRVEGNPGDKFGFVNLQPSQVAPNASLLIYHHPAGLPLRLTRFRCKAYAGQTYSGTSFRHRCDTLGGSSGSLIYDNNHAVVALHHSGGLTNDSASSFNLGTDIRAVLKRIAESDLQNGQNKTVPSIRPKAQTTAKVVIARVPGNVSGNKMNVRAGPGLSHAVVGAIPGNSSDVRLYIDSCRQADDGRTRKPWCRINWQGLTGWTSVGGLRW